MRQQGLGDLASGRRFPPEVHGMWASDHGPRKMVEKNTKIFKKRKNNALQSTKKYVKIKNRDIFYILAL